MVKIKNRIAQTFTNWEIWENADCNYIFDYFNYSLFGAGCKYKG